MMSNMILIITMMVSTIFHTSYSIPIFTENDDWHQFSFFQSRFRKEYSSVKEMESRFLQFKENLIMIKNHNSIPFNNYTMGINQFADLSSDEFKGLYITGMGKASMSSNCDAFPEHFDNLPTSIDWRYNNVVTSVKDQGQCGSCWAFSATGAIEGALAISKNVLVDLSEQQLVDCASGLEYGSHGCNGGLMDGAFKYVQQFGQCNYSDYPYTSGITEVTGKCQKCVSVVKVSSCFDITPNDQLSLMSAVAMRPVSIAIEADTKYFQFYSGGVLTSSSCGTTLDHGVLIVGYGEENGIKYWLVKNSWSSTWGDDGYVKIERSDSTNDAGVCGIAMMASFPVV